MFRVWGFPILRIPFAGPYSKDYSLLVSILGSPYGGKLPLVGILCKLRTPLFGGRQYKWLGHS